MARPVQRGAAWSLRQVAEVSRVRRSVLRAAEAAGLLAGPYTATDVVLARVAAACLAHPGPAEDATGAITARRDKDALRLARGMLADPRTRPRAALLVSAARALAADDDAEILDGLGLCYPDPVVVLPVGWWIDALPTTIAAADTARTHRAHQATPRRSRATDDNPSTAPATSRAPRRTGSPVSLGAALAGLGLTPPTLPSAPAGQTGQTGQPAGEPW